MPTKRHIMRPFKIRQDILEKFMAENYFGVEFCAIKLADENAIKRGSYGMRPSDIKRLANKYVFTIVVMDRIKWGELLPSGTPNDGYYRHIVLDSKGNLIKGSIKNASGAVANVIGGVWYTPPLGTNMCTACGRLSTLNYCPNSIIRQQIATCVYCGEALHGRQQKRIRVCPYCAAKNANVRHAYHDWGYAPVFSNPKERNKKLHLGYELELHTRLEDYADWDDSESDNTVAYATRKIGESINKDVYRPFWHFEADGSLNNHGIECISEPLIISAHKKSMAEVQKALDIAVENDCYVNERAGVHIHIDREWFNGHDKLGSLKIAYLLNEFSPEINCFAGRHQTSYCSRSSIKKDDDVLQSWTKLCNNGGHHSAVNICNASTIEFRIWASTTRVEDLMMYIDFTQALAKIAKFKSYETLANIKFEEVGKYLVYRSSIDIMEMRGLPMSVAKELRRRFDETHKEKKK